MTVLALARLAGRRHQWNEMMGLLDQCADLFSAITDPQGVAQVLRSRGSALRRMGKLDEAGDVLDAAHDALQKVGDRRSHGRTHYSKALLEIDRLNWGQALAEVASADRLFNDDDDGPWRCRVSVTRLRALTQDQKARPCTTDEFDGLRSDLAGFAALAGDGFVPLWITTARRRFGIQT
jgi:tetratricopeptide (TPR) repeat protein